MNQYKFRSINSINVYLVKKVGGAMSFSTDSLIGLYAHLSYYLHVYTNVFNRYLYLNYLPVDRKSDNHCVL